LSLNNWHHVTVRWGTDEEYLGYGDITIDGRTVTTFSIPSSSLAPPNFATPTTSGDPSDSEIVLLGNYYDKQNVYLDEQSRIFNASAASTEGVTQLNSATDDPSNIVLNNPLNAEVHDVRLYNKLVTDTEIANAIKSGPSDLEDLLFYLPVLFTREARIKQNLVTPFQTDQFAHNTPFNFYFSHGIGGNLINVDNFLREFVRGEYPRLFNLTASYIESVPTSEQDKEADYFLYNTGSIRYRNNLVMPNDNGLFRPNYSLLSTYDKTLFKNDLSNEDLGIVTLNDNVSDALINDAVRTQSGSIFESAAGVSPGSYTAGTGSMLTVLQRTRDTSSNHVAFFDISNIFYGDRINPGTFTIVDHNLTGSSTSRNINDQIVGDFKLTMRDNKIGGLYRADALTPHAKWSRCGAIGYSEGIVSTLHPSLVYFGKDGYNFNFEGERSIYTMKINAFSPKGMINSSSNPSYLPVSASNDANDNSQEFVYIDTINFHDENLNIIAKTGLAQPVMKRNDDSFLFRVKIDF